MQRPRKVECEFCHGKFHGKGIHSHRARCKQRLRLPTMQTVVNERGYAENLVATSSDLQHQRELGRKEGEEKYKQKFTDVQIKALEAAAHAVEAIAHMVGDLR